MDRDGINVDDREFQKWLARYAAETGRGLKEILREEGGLLAKDVMRVTPPTWGGGQFSQSWAKQKSAGVMAVNRDIARSYMPLSQVQKEARSLTGDVSAKVFFRLVNRDVPAALLWMQDAGMPQEMIDAVRRGVKSFDGGADHERKRGRRGRVLSRSPSVVKGAGLASYRKKKLARVLRLKAGWYKAAAGLPLRGVPSSIMKASAFARGSRIDQTGAKKNPYISLVNHVQYAGDANGDIRFTNIATAHRRGVFVKKVERIVRSGWKARR